MHVQYIDIDSNVLEQVHEARQCELAHNIHYIITRNIPQHGYAFFLQILNFVYCVAIYQSEPNPLAVLCMSTLVASKLVVGLLYSIVQCVSDVV